MHGKKVLGMDSLLNGKTRKEASRMFFETLVSVIIECYAEVFLYLGDLLN